MKCRRADKINRIVRYPYYPDIGPHVFLYIRGNEICVKGLYSG